MNKKLSRGFTLIEVLIVIGIIAILAAVVLVALNPSRNFSQANNTLRTAHLNSILSAVSQYSVENRGKLPTDITTSVQEICKTGVAQATCDAAGFAYLPELTLSGNYGLDALPVDPICPDGCDADSTEYNIVKNGTGQVTVCAPKAELQVSICIKR